jgi:hypothetical protein
MAYKIKKLRKRKLTKSEVEFYQKGYWDASVGNKKAYSMKDTKKPIVWEWE